MSVPPEAPLSRDIIALYDEYTHAPLDRRVFLDRLARLAGGTAAALALLPVLENDYAHAAVVAEDDPRLTTQSEAIAVPGGSLAAYVAKPADAAAPLPAVVVIHENRGLNPHIRDVARRLALGGYLAVAPDMLSADGDPTPADEDVARERIGALDPAQTLENALAVVAYARGGRRDASGRVGVVGFCWGGGLVNQLAVHDPALDAAVSFYGRQPSPEDAATIQVPLMLHYAGLDERINAGIDAYVAALDAAGADYTLHMYDGVDHAFHNDTNAARYDEGAAALAWERTLAFFAQHLAG
ncbi:MAG: dienelactone hydrolase family protein [Rhodospirillaceae bacterium]|nr:dienelactone hydrolase family protein [Rhodospirillaceae bacterium]